MLAGHIRGGWVKAMSSSSTESVDGLSDILHPRKRFYAGGANSVRGYGENQLGPRILTIDPAKLITGAGCTTANIASGTCDPNGHRHRYMCPETTSRRSRPVALRSSKGVLSIAFHS